MRKSLKTHEHSNKNQKKKPKEQPRPEEMLERRPPTLRNTPLSHAHTASPRPLARTHDTNTKRNRNRFPDWGSPASINSPQSPIYIYIYIYIHIYSPNKDGSHGRGSYFVSIVIPLKIRIARRQPQPRYLGQGT